MEHFANYFNSLTGVEQTLLVVGAFFGVLFLLQFVWRLLAGFDADTDMSDVHGEVHDGGLDGDHRGSSLSESFSLMNISIFFTCLGLVSFTFIQSGWWVSLAVLTGGVTGVVGVALNIFVWRQLMNLTEDNTTSLRAASHKRATVYLTIPGKNQGTGEVIVEIGGANRHVAAFTEDEEPIPANTQVTVVRTLSDRLQVAVPTLGV